MSLDLLCPTFACDLRERFLGEGGGSEKPPYKSSCLPNAHCEGNADMFCAWGYQCSHWEPHTSNIPIGVPAVPLSAPNARNLNCVAKLPPILQPLAPIAAN